MVPFAAAADAAGATIREKELREKARFALLHVRDRSV